MTTFDKREKAEEARWSHDKDLLFKATARRNKLLGLWAGELLGLSGAAADAYAKEVVVADFDKPGDDDVLNKVLNDLRAKGVETSEHRVRKRMDELMAELMAEAKRQVLTEKKD